MKSIFRHRDTAVPSITGILLCAVLVMLGAVLFAPRTPTIERVHVQAPAPTATFDAVLLRKKGNPPQDLPVNTPVIVDFNTIKFKHADVTNKCFDYDEDTDELVVLRNLDVMILRAMVATDDSLPAGSGLNCYVLRDGNINNPWRTNTGKFGEVRDEMVDFDELLGVPVFVEDYVGSRFAKYGAQGNTWMVHNVTAGRRFSLCAQWKHPSSVAIRKLNIGGSYATEMHVLGWPEGTFDEEAP